MTIKHLVISGGGPIMIQVLGAIQHLEKNEISDAPILDFVDQTDYLDSDFNPSVTLINTEDRYTVLYIDDNKDLLDFVSSKLSIEYSMFTSDGKNAIEQAFEIVPDIIICDLNLPEKNGFEICQILKKDLRTSHIPIIILTASDDQESYLKAL